MLDAISPCALDDVVRLGTGEARSAHFRPLVEAFAPRIRRFFGKKRGAAEVDDLTQETFLRVYRSERSFQSATEFEPWLVTIAANLYRNDVRARTAEKRLAPEAPLALLEEVAVPAAVPGAASGLAGRVEDPLEAALGQEERDQLARALHELPDKMRRCALLRYQGDFTYQEIAAMLNVSIETVKAHLYQARRKLKTRLSPYFDRAAEEDST